MRSLGSYELQEDGARAYDKVARILGKVARILGQLNFPNSGAVEIYGPRSEGADKAVAAAVKEAKTFVAAGGNNQTSTYIGVTKIKSSPKNPWQSMIMVSSRNVGSF